MRAPISVVIPTLNAAGRLGPCLAALTEGLMAGLIAEVVITDGGSEDAIAELADAVGARLVTGPMGRGTQLRAGAAVARGDWLLFLHADTVLRPGWADAVRAHIEARPGRAGYARLRFDSRRFMAHVTAGWANLRSALFALPYGDQTLLIRRDLYDAVGGYAAVPIMEDVIIVRALGRARLAPLDAVAVTSAEKYEAEGWVRRGWRNISTVALFFLGRSPQSLLARYRGRR